MLNVIIIVITLIIFKVMNFSFWSETPFKVFLFFIYEIQLSIKKILFDKVSGKMQIF